MIIPSCGFIVCWFLFCTCIAFVPHHHLWVLHLPCRLFLSTGSGWVHSSLIHSGWLYSFYPFPPSVIFILLPVLLLLHLVQFLDLILFFSVLWFFFFFFSSTSYLPIILALYAHLAFETHQPSSVCILPFCLHYFYFCFYLCLLFCALVAFCALFVRGVAFIFTLRDVRTHTSIQTAFWPDGTGGGQGREVWGLGLFGPCLAHCPHPATATCPDICHTCRHLPPAQAWFVLYSLSLSIFYLSLSVVLPPLPLEATGGGGRGRAGRAGLEGGRRAGEADWAGFRAANIFVCIPFILIFLEQMRWTEQDGAVFRQTGMGWNILFSRDHSPLVTLCASTNDSQNLCDFGQFWHGWVGQLVHLCMCAYPLLLLYELLFPSLTAVPLCSLFDFLLHLSPGCFRHLPPYLHVYACFKHSPVPSPYTYPTPTTTNSFTPHNIELLF